MCTEKTINFIPKLVRYRSYTYKKEKGFLSPLPQDNIRSLYKIKELSLKADSQGFVSYSGKKYSTPIKYCGKVLNAQGFR